MPQDYKTRYNGTLAAGAANAGEIGSYPSDILRALRCPRDLAWMSSWAPSNKMMAASLIAGASGMTSPGTANPMQLKQEKERP